MAESGERRFLADKFTPSFLMDLCDGQTGFQAQGTTRPFIGEWIRVRGALFQATPNQPQGTAGVTIEFPNDGKYRREAFLTFNRNFDDLCNVNIGDVIWAQGILASISSHSLRLADCELIDPRLAATLEVRYQATELQKAIGDAATENASAQAACEADTEASKSARTRHIGTGEMRKFAKLYLEIWGTAAKEITAWEAMKACYPDGIIGRDPFLKEFRELRGPGKRGNPAIRGQ